MFRARISRFDDIRLLRPFVAVIIQNVVFDKILKIIIFVSGITLFLQEVKDILYNIRYIRLDSVYSILGRNSEI